LRPIVDRTRQQTSQAVGLAIVMANIGQSATAP
jgi:hypothetical protein